jgi:hypothetical protein
MCPVGEEFFHADIHTDGRTDIQDEANIRFSQFCEKRLKNRSLSAVEGRKRGME